MRPNDPNRGPIRRRLRPCVEGLEGRDLPSAGPHPAGAVHALGDPTGLRVSNKPSNLPYTTSFNGLIGKGRLQPFLDPNVVGQAVAALYGPAPAPGSPNPSYPTPDEIRREEFTATAVGRYVVGPPTFSGRSERVYAFGKIAASSAFLKSKWQVVLHPPADPAATPNPGDPYANQTTGVATLISQSYFQSGTGLVLDLNSVADPRSDPHALPAQGTWAVDTTSAGAFTTPLGFTQGAGTWTAQYQPDPNPLPGSMGSGRVVFRFQGVYNFSQLISSLSKVYS